MAKDFDKEDGVWRTIGGRRVFIRNGQSLSDAMKESGKFKSAKKTKIGDERDKKLKDVLEKNKNKTQGELRRAISESKDETEKIGLKDLYDNMTNEDKNIAKAMNELSQRDVNDLFDQLNDEGSDFTFGETKIEDGKIKTSVGVFMPDERGYTERELEIPLDKDETYASLEEKVRDWQSRHSSPDSFEDEDFKTSRTTNENKLSNKEIKSLQHEARKMRNEAERTTGEDSEEYWKKFDDINDKLGKDRIDYRYDNQSTNEISKETQGKNFRNSLTKLSDKSIEDGTYDLETGKKVDFGNEGYNVSFEQSSDNYSDSEYYDKIEECRKLCDGKVYGGKFGGDPEISFYTKDKDVAMQIMEKYNQHSIYDNSIGDVIENPKYNAETNKVNYNEKPRKDAFDYSREEVTKAYETMREKMQKHMDNNEERWSGKEYTNAEFLAHLEDANWHGEMKQLREANLTPEQLTKIKDKTTLSSWGVGSELTGRENVQKMIDSVKDKSSNETMNNAIREKASKTGKKIPSNLSRDIYKLDEDKGNAWSGNGTTKNANGETIARVTKNGPSQNSPQDIKEAIEKKYPYLEGKILGNNEVQFSVKKEATEQYKNYQNRMNETTNDNKSIKQLNDEMLGNNYKGKGETPSLVYSNGRRIDIANNADGGKTATIWKDGKIERKTILPDNVKGDKTKDYFDKYLKDLDDTNNKDNTSNDWVRKAFEEYKKKHPNTKKRIEDFRK